MFRKVCAVSRAGSGLHFPLVADHEQKQEETLTQAPAGKTVS